MFKIKSNELTLQIFNILIRIFQTYCRKVLHIYIYIYIYGLDQDMNHEVMQFMSNTNKTSNAITNNLITRQPNLIETTYGVFLQPKQHLRPFCGDPMT
jgi:hypothetical protein